MKYKLSKSEFAVTGIDGIEIQSGEKVYPGLSNSYSIIRKRKWIIKYREFWLPFFLFFVGSLGMALRAFIPEFDDSSVYEELPIVEFGDIPVKSKTAVTPKYEIDEVFGNEYVKKDVEVVKVVSTDEVFASTAMGGVPGGATRPVDLTPEIAPPYTPEARAAAIEGTIVLEIIVDESGKVTHARVVKDNLGHGLAAGAIKVYKREKQFSPSIGPDGKPMRVKFYQPVRFQLM